MKKTPLSIANPEIASEWHPTKNGELKPSDVTCSCNKSVWWICKNGHEWKANIRYRTAKKGTGCPYCANQKVWPGYNDLLTTNPLLAMEWDYDNNLTTPKEVTRGSNKLVWWICSTCHFSYEKSPSRRLAGENCPYCSGKKVKIGYNDLETWCKNNKRYDLINEFDNKKNSFQMTEITSGNGRKIWWICPKGHSYQATLHHRINMGTGCGICSHKVFRKGENDLLSTNPEIAKEWDYEKNDVNPDEVMAGSNTTKYWFICPKGHSYQSTLLSRKKGTNCPICDIERHISFPEKAIFYYMKLHFNTVYENYRAPFLGKKEIDVYLPDQKVGIEYDGRAWHKDKKKDIAKDKECEQNGIVLFRIRECGCIEYDSSSIKTYVTPYNMKELNDAIRFVFTELNRAFLMSISADIDVDRDRTVIFDQIHLSEKDNSIASCCPTILEYWDTEKNGKLTPEQISHSSIKKIFLKCSLGHEWETTANSFSSAPRCPFCSGRKVWPGYNDLFTTNPELVPLWSKNNSIDPRTIKKGSNSRALWVCPNCKGEYEMQVSKKTSGGGCPYCSGHQVLKGFNDLRTKSPRLVAEWDFDKNSPLQPDEVTTGSNKIAWWKCQNGHEWQARISSRSKGKGCPYCAGKKVTKGFTDLHTVNPTLSLEWNYEKNNGLTPEDVLPNSHETVWWKCQKGHEWEATISGRNRGNGCPYCAGQKSLQGHNDLQTVNHFLSSEWNYEKNNGLTPGDVLPNSHLKVWWRCNNGHEWQARISNRNNGNGCPQCAKEKRKPKFGEK